MPSLRRVPSVRLLAAALLAVACLTLAAVGRAAAASTGSVQVGSLTLHACPDGVSARMLCGSIQAPLDYASTASPDITIGFEYLPASGTASGTVLATEGGPGFATTGSAASYVSMLGPLTATRNLLLVDLRGTGDSTPVLCKGLQDDTVDPDDQYGPRFGALVADCADGLDHTWHYRHGGGWVDASDLFDTANSARDVATVVQDLGIGQVDLYGDSYGSWFAQTFASRYPQLLRTVTLDSTYQVLGLDPWYVNSVETMRTAFDEECAGWAPCAQTAGAPAWTVISQLAARLDQGAVSGETASLDGTQVPITVNTETLVNLVNNSGFDPVIYQQLVGAARSLESAGDAAPLLRLAEQSLSTDDANDNGVHEFSDGLFFAVSCTDYPQLFDRDAPTQSDRLAQYAQSVAAEPADTFAPFTVTQWATDMDQYNEAYQACAYWPARARIDPPIVTSPPLVPASVPVLVLSGTADSLTPRLDGASVVAQQMGPSARLVSFANLTHVVEDDGDNACPESVLQTFLSDPAGLMSQDVSCAAQVAPIHVAGEYPLTLAGALPATAAPGNAAGTLALRGVTVALDAVGDEITRDGDLSGDSDLGLRGGTVTFSGSRRVTMTFDAVRQVTDATTSGTATWNTSTDEVVAQLTVTGPDGMSESFTADWNTYAQADQPATVSGTANGVALQATAPAP